MITGYNTDVRHQDVVFHVQTEDKGSGNPFIESLVYVGGQVLATRRTEYRDLLDAGGDDKAVLARMEKQHRAMIAAIRRGKLDDRMADLMGDGPAGQRPAPAGGGDTTVGSGAGSAAVAAAAQPAVGDRPSAPASTPAAGDGTGGGSTPAPAAAPAANPVARPAAGGLPPEGDRTLDQVILDYLSNEAEQEHLELRISGDPHVAVGSPASLELHAVSSKSRSPVVGAKVVVRMISTVAEPRTLTSGATDGDGRLALRFDVPDLGRGTTALIINASSELGRAELKQLL